MTATTPVLSLLLIILISSLLLLHLPCPSNTRKPLRPCNFNAIYQLVDSLSDTGNLILEDPASRFARLPYGQAFFKKPTGRCSNGFLMIDYIGLDASSLQKCCCSIGGASSLQKCCCGIGGDYNYDRAKPCGASGVPVCSKP